MNENWTGENLSHSRNMLGLSQKQFARILCLSQATISRWEQSNEMIPPNLKEQVMFLMEDAAKVREVEVSRAERKQTVVDGLQESLGTAIAAGLAWFPRRLQQSIYRHLCPEPRSIKLDDSSLDAEKRALVSDAERKELLPAIDDLREVVRRALLADPDRIDDAMATCRAGIALCKSDGCFESYLIDFRHNFGVCLTKRREFDQARVTFQDVVERATFTQDKASAWHELGILERDAAVANFYTLSIVDLRKRFLAASEYFVLANGGLKGCEVKSAVEMLVLADRVHMFLKDRAWADQLVASSGEFVAQLDKPEIERQLALVRPPEGLTSLLPSISKRRGLLQRLVPWVYATAVVVLLSDATASEAFAGLIDFVHIIK